MKKDDKRFVLSMEAIVGVFMIFIMLGMGYFTIILSGNTWLKKRFALEAVFPDVKGLREGDNIVVRGMPVGKVDVLHLEADGVHVVGQLKKPLEVREGYRVRIVNTSILGGRYMQVETGPAGGAALPDGTVLVGETAHDLVDDAAGVVDEVKRGLAQGGIVTNVAQVVRELKEIVTRVNAGQGTLGKLLSPDDTLYKDLSASIASLKDVSARLQDGSSTLGKLLAKDTTMYDNLDKTLASMRTITERVEGGKGFAGKLLSEDETLYNDLAASAASIKVVSKRLEEGEGTLGRLLTKDDQLYQDLKGATAALRSISERIDRGEGLLGRLVRDDTLYTQIQQLIGEARATIDDYRETSPVVSFTTILFGAF